MPSFIKLPSERVEQLRALAKNLDITISDCIGMFVNEQITKGNLEPGVPGFRIYKDGDEIHVGTDEWDRLVSTRSASNLAKSIRALVTPSKDNPFMPLPDDFGLARRGTSLKLKDSETGAEKTMAHSIAKDVADMLERAAKS